MAPGREVSEWTLPLSPGRCRLALPVRPAEDGGSPNEAWERCHCSMSSWGNWKLKGWWPTERQALIHGQDGCMGKAHPAVVGGNAGVAHASSRAPPRERKARPVEASVSTGPRPGRWGRAPGRGHAGRGATLVSFICEVGVVVLVITGLPGAGCANSWEEPGAKSGLTP